MLDIHRGNIETGAAAEPLLGEFEFVRTLKNDQIDVLIAQFVDGDLVCTRPLTSRQTTPVGIFRPVHRHDVAVSTGDQRLQPGAVYMPHQK